MDAQTSNTSFKENVILVDVDCVDATAGKLREHFEQALGRQIPDADLAEWLVCAALDGGVTEGENQVQCVLVHAKDKRTMQHFFTERSASDYQPKTALQELDGKAFMDNALGEFQISCLCNEGLGVDDFFTECVRVLVDSKEVKRLVVVPEVAKCADALTSIFKQAPKDKEFTLLSMQPLQDVPHVMLGFSLLHAMGIKGDEL